MRMDCFWNDPPFHIWVVSQGSLFCLLEWLARVLWSQSFDCTLASLMCNPTCATFILASAVDNSFTAYNRAYYHTPHWVCVWYLIEGLSTYMAAYLHPHLDVDDGYQACDAHCDDDCGHIPFLLLSHGIADTANT